MKKIFFLLQFLAATFLAHAQNVGIGTTTPGAQLHIAATNLLDTARGAIMMSRYWISATDTRSSAIYHLFNSATGKDQLVLGVSGDGGVYTSPTLYSNAKMVIQANGNIGMGTVLPAAKLHVSGGSASLALFGPNSFGGKLYVGASPTQDLASTAQVISTDGNLHIDPAPGKNMYLGYFQPGDIYVNPNGGKVAIGTTTTPLYTLDVRSNLPITGYFANTATSRGE